MDQRDRVVGGLLEERVPARCQVRVAHRMAWHVTFSEAHLVK
ncbi:hypothetical protein [Mycobacterium sp.]